jgi:hypothetical protein
MDRRSHCHVAESEPTVKLQRKRDIIIYGINLGVCQLRGHRLLTHQQ